MKTYPLTQSQLGIFIEMMQHPQMTQYNLGYMTSLPKSIDLDRFEQALRTIYANCPAFRIRFLTEGDELRQTVDETRELPIFRLTLSESECEEYLQTALRPFDPFSDVLCVCSHGQKMKNRHFTLPLTKRTGNTSASITRVVRPSPCLSPSAIH